jgi:hypothetical protein
LAALDCDARNCCCVFRRQSVKLQAMRSVDYGKRSKRLVALILIASAMPVSDAVCATGDDAWHRLRLLKHDVDLVFIERDGACINGRIKAVEDNRVLISEGRSEAAIDRASLIRVRLGFGGRPVLSNNPNMPLFTVYSGRSSWADLVAFAPFQSKDHPGFALHLSVTGKDGKLHRGNLSSITEDDITLADPFGALAVFPKAEVSYVDYVREKPLNDTEEFHWEELAMLRIFDVNLYPRLFHSGDTMSVRLFDSSIPVDDSPVQCK